MDLIITHIYKKKYEESFYNEYNNYSIEHIVESKAKGIGFISNYNVIQKILYEEGFATKFMRTKHKTELGDIFITELKDDMSFEFVAADILEIPEKLFNAIVR